MPRKIIAAFHDMQIDTIDEGGRKGFIEQAVAHQRDRQHRDLSQPITKAELDVIRDVVKTCIAELVLHEPDIDVLKSKTPALPKELVESLYEGYKSFRGQGGIDAIEMLSYGEVKRVNTKEVVGFLNRSLDIHFEDLAAKLVPPVMQGQLRGAVDGMEPSPPAPLPQLIPLPPSSPQRWAENREPDKLGNRCLSRFRARTQRIRRGLSRLRRLPSRGAARVRIEPGLDSPQVGLVR